MPTDLIPMIGSLDRVRLAAARVGHAMLELAEWNAGPHPEFENGERLLRLERYADAESCFLKVAADLKPRSGVRGRLARTLVALAQAQRKQGKLVEARENADAARQLFAAREKPCSELASCLELLASIREDDGSAEEARSLFREAVEIEEKLVPLQPLMLIQRYWRLAKALSDTDESQTREVLNRAVEIAEKRLGTHSPAAAECLTELGQFQILKGEKEAGILSMERALEIHRQTHGAGSDEVIHDLERLASACHVAGDLERAVQYYERALSMRERQVGGSPADTAALLIALADAHSLLGNDAPAMEMLQQAVGKLEGSDDEHLPWALESLGVSYSKSGRFDDAISCYSKARVLWEKQPDANQEMLQANALRLEEAKRYAPPEVTSCSPLLLFKEWSSAYQEGPPHSAGSDGLRQPSAPKPSMLHPRLALAEIPVQAANIELGSVITPPRQVDPPSAPRLVSQEYAASEAAPGDQTARFASLNVIPSHPKSGWAMTGPVSGNVTPAEFLTVGPEKLAASREIDINAPANLPISAVQHARSDTPLHLMIVVPEGSLSTGAYPSPIRTLDPAHLNYAELAGWDELAFDRLSSPTHL